MKIITLNFIAFLGYENNTRGGGEHGIKKNDYYKHAYATAVDDQ